MALDEGGVCDYNSGVDRSDVLDGCCFIAENDRFFSVVCVCLVCVCVCQNISHCFKGYGVLIY